MGREIRIKHGAFELAGRGLQHNGLRRANERAVLTVIAFNPGVSNADISRLTGLAPQTVSAILVELERVALITRGEVLRGRRGQPATPILLSATGAYAIGVEISWRHLAMVLINMHGETVREVLLDYAFPDAGTLLQTITGQVNELTATLPEAERGKISDIGVAMPNNMGRSMAGLGNLPEQGRLWTQLDIAQVLEQATGLGASICNDGNAACWAELMVQPGQPGNFIYLLVAHYLAGGLIGEGVLWEGPTGNSANLGVMLATDAQGQLQPAYKLASLEALERRLAAAGFGLDAPLQTLADWDAFEPVVDPWLAEAAKALAEVIYNTQAVLENRIIVIGGLMPAPVLERLVAATQIALLRLPGAADWRPEVRAGLMGALGPAVGAAKLSLFKRYFSRTLADLAV